MTFRKILSLVLTIAIAASFIPQKSAFASDIEKKTRMLYVHAQSEPNPKETTNVSTVYIDETANIYLAIDNPNKGEYDAQTDKHKEPEYDLNGYTVRFYYDDYYLSLIDPVAPIVYDEPNGMNSNGGTGTGADGITPGTNPDDVENVPSNDKGYYVYRHGTEEIPSCCCSGR